MGRMGLMTAAMVMWLANAAWAVEPEKSSLDDALEKELDSGLLDGLEKIPVRSEPAKSPSASTPRPDQPPVSDLDRQLLDELGQGAPGASTEESNPLAQIADRMRVVQRQIEKKNTSTQTQLLQREIVDDLSTLIEQLQKQCQQCSGGNAKPSSSASSKPGKPGAGSGGAGEPSNKPASESTDRLGDEKSDEEQLSEMKNMLKELWGHLPAKVREQMQSGAVERFLPKYETLIEAYYKRLAEEPAP